MSRCFPFPPPGYERELRPEDLVLLKEVKHKEKKRKKEKKDKERKKDKGKKEKDGSGEKQKDKKDKKRKHKDKKEKDKDKKDKGKDKEKSSISEEATIAGKLEERNGEKPHPKLLSKDSSVADEGKCSTFFPGQNGGKPSQSILPSQVINKANFLLELDRRVRDDESCRGSQFPDRLASVDKRDQEVAAGPSFRNPSRVLEEDKSNGRDKRVHIQKMETQRLDDEFIGKAMVESLTRVGRSKNEGTSRSVEEQNDWRLDSKVKCNGTGDDKQGDKQKEKDKKSREKDKVKKKEKKKEEKAKLKIKNKKSEHEKSKNVGANDPVVATSHKNTKLLKDDNAALNEENVRKRKNMDTNGFLHESEIRPYKVQSLALHESTENGRKLKASHISSNSSFDKNAPSNACLDNRDRLSNGIIEAQIPAISKPSTSGTIMAGDPMVVVPKTKHPDFSTANEAPTVPKMKAHIAEEAPKRPPHPDSKYLSQVLTVPTVGDWSESDDQEWLFSKKGPPKLPRLESPGTKEELCVWSEAVHIESADVYALPYVIPY